MNPSGPLAQPDQVPLVEPTRMIGNDSARSDDGQLIDFVELRAVVMRNKWIILGVLTGTMLAAAVLTALSVPMFRAESTLEVDSRQSNVLDVEDVQAEIPAQGSDEFLRTQIEIIESRAIAEAVAEDLGLLNNDDFLVAMNANPVSEDLSGREAADARKRAVVGQLLQNRTVTKVPESRIITITFASPDANLASRVTNSYTENYIEDSLTRRFNVTAYARQFVAEQLAEARERLEDSEANLATYARNTGIVSTGSNADGDPSGSLTNDTISQTNQELVQARSARIQAEQSWRSAQNSPALSLPAVYQNSAVSNLLRRRAELRAQLAEVKQRYISNSPEVQEAEAELGQIEREISSISANIKDSIRRNYEATLGRERELGSALQGLTGQQQGEQSRNVEYSILNREVATNRALYDGLLQRYRELTASAGLTGNNITVVDKAERPRIPFAPQPTRNMMIALVLGLVLAALATLLREQIFNRIRTPDDVRRHLSVPLLATIPRPKGVDIEQALEENLSNISESFQTLTSILALSGTGGVPKSLFTTSGRAGEGKSTTSFAIAKNLVRRGNRVLMVDADMRRPNMHKLLGLDNENGLAEVLAGQTVIADAIRTVQEPLAIDFLPSGHIPPNPVDLLSSVAFKNLLDVCGEKYDHILIDGPPVLGLSDALILSSHVDATLFALEAGEWRPAQTRDMIARLNNHAKQLLGLVMTKFDAKGEGYQYYYQEYEYDYANS